MSSHDILIMLPRCIYNATTSRIEDFCPVEYISLNKRALAKILYLDVKFLHRINKNLLTLRYFNILSSLNDLANSYPAVKNYIHTRTYTQTQQYTTITAFHACGKFDFLDFENVISTFVA